MTRRLTLTLKALAQCLTAAPPPGRFALRNVGPLRVQYADPPNADAGGRWRTAASYGDQFVLLVDEFRAKRAAPFRLRLEAAQPLAGDRRRYLTRDRQGPLVLHVLGDYATDRRRKAVTVEQRLAQGRFLVALSRDPQAVVRVLNGWAVEMRSLGRVVHLLHSNRSHRLRPLGPLQTDARFAVAEWPEQPDGAFPPASAVTLHALQATQVVWGEKRQLATSERADVAYQAD